MTTTATEQCSICRGLLRDDGTCYHCKQHARVVAQALRWCKLTALPSANLARAWSPLALLGHLEISHSRRGYWVVTGDVPLALAWKLYEDPCGRDLIRVDGHCGCPAPEAPWVEYRTADGKVLADRKNERSFDEIIADDGAMAETMREAKAQYVFVDDPAAVGIGFVKVYHIDGDLGLRVFCDIVRAGGAQ